jgi:hypothetical protein
MKPGIKNIENLSAVFGSVEIPSFHNAEIVSVFLTWENNVSMELVLLFYRINRRIQSRLEK